MTNYEIAADYYKAEESKRFIKQTQTKQTVSLICHKHFFSYINDCVLKIAKCAAQLEKYKKAILIYEEV